jgi:hypothetical protein
MDAAGSGYVPVADCFDDGNTSSIFEKRRRSRRETYIAPG